MSADLRKHPEYSDGFFDAQEGAALVDDASPAYRAGWEAYQRVREIFRSQGFTEENGGFSFKATIR